MIGQHAVEKAARRTEPSRSEAVAVERARVGLTELYAPSSAHPVVGQVTQWKPQLGGMFGEFETATMHGLVLVTGDRIDILSIVSKEGGKGHFSEFLASLQASYRTIGIWEIMNPDLKRILAKKGFRFVQELVDGDNTSGMRWDREAGS